MPPLIYPVAIVKYFSLKPQVAGRLGDQTEFDAPNPPRKITKLHYIFESWPDKIVKKVTAYAIEEGLKKEIERLGATGARFRPCIVSKGEQFHIAEPGRSEPLPSYFQLEPVGIAGKDDFGTTSTGGLFVSERVLNAILATEPTDLLVEPLESA